MTTKKLIRSLIGPRNEGRLGYLCMPWLRNSWGGYFNGQAHRQKMYHDLLRTLNFKAIIETGTFRGTTTELFMQSGLPIYTSEINPSNFAYSEMRFRKQRDQVHLHESDSIDFLRQLAYDNTVPKEVVFFYFDAHWFESLPVREELKLAFTHWKEAVVMVDDFEVPGTSYGYDDYGGGKILNLGFLEPLAELKLHAYFPSVSPNDETGAKRGSVVLCREERVAKLLNGINSLVRSDQSVRL